MSSLPAFTGILMTEDKLPGRSAYSREPNTSLQRVPSIASKQGPMQSKKHVISTTGETNRGTDDPPTDNRKAGGKGRRKSPTREELRAISREHMKIADMLFSEEETRSAMEIIQKSDASVLSSQGFADQNQFHHILDALEDEIKRNNALLRDPPSRVREFVQHLVIRHPQILLHSRHDHEQQQLFPRVLKKCKPLALDIIELVFANEEMKALQEPCPNQTKSPSTGSKPCQFSQLHLTSALRSEFEKPSGGLCIHERLDCKRFEAWVKNYRNTMSKALELPEDHTDGRETWLHLALEDHTAFATTTTAPNSETDLFHRSFVSLIKLCADRDSSKNLLLSCDSEGRIPLHRAIEIFRYSDINYTHLTEVIEVLVHACPQSIDKAAYKDTNKQDSHPKTPYRLLKDLPDNKNEEQKRSIELVDRLLKHVCIRSNKTKTEKQKYLHENLADAPEIHLNLSHIRGPGRRYMDERAEKIRAELDSALEYVSLPQHHPTEGKHPEGPQGQGDKLEDERNPHVAIFQWLRDRGVEKIFRVSVEDREPCVTPHTDEAIQECLKPFDIEIWDWRKFDIASETIINGAANSRELHLYWSGNIAVMQSWACKRGLARLTQVQSIKITLAENVRMMEADNFCNDAFLDFKRRFCRRRKDVPERNIQLQMPRKQNQLAPLGNESIQGGSTNDPLAAEPVWIRTMQEFIDMLGMAKLPREDVVKIAVIDSGVDTESPGIQAIERGESFYHGGRELTQGGAWDPEFLEWNASPPIHGTHMAICIQKVCPMARLYVARLDNSNMDTQEFTLDSAIKAVKWAQEMGVDIISMSWSFKAKGESYDMDQVTEFKRTIAEAKSKDILLFASLNDTEGITIDDYYPCGLTDVFKIGSATKWGYKAAHSLSGADFILPGKDIALPDVDNKMRHEVSGSSIATAFASGLAGLVLCALAAHKQYSDDVDDGVKAERLKQAKSREGMNTIFNVLSGNRQSINKDVWVSLNDKFPEKTDKGDPGPDLKDFIKGIFPK